MTVQITARNASLEMLRDLLVDQQARKVDIVAPAGKIRANNGLIVVKGTEPVLDETGFTYADGTYRPTEVFDEGVAAKLGIPLGYLRTLRASRPDLYDQNVNGWLHGSREKRSIATMDRVTGELKPGRLLREAIPGDGRSFLLRTFRPDDGGEGIARAFLSDRYSVMDNLDALTAALDGVRQAGVQVDIEGADLSDRRMYVRIVAPQVKALAPVLLERYRSPFSGDRGIDNPTVFAGFVISNSETGSGAFTIVPRLVVQVCSNGLTITKDALRAVHLGGKMDESVIRWSEDTQRKDLQLVTARARDAVRTFVDVGYMERVIRGIEEKAGKPLSGIEESIKVVSKKLAFDQDTQDAVFRMFVRGGDLTAGGVMNAVTAAAREMEDADKAHELEANALRALEVAWSL